MRKTILFLLSFMIMDMATAQWTNPPGGIYGPTSTPPASWVFVTASQTTGWENASSLLTNRTVKGSITGPYTNTALYSTGQAIGDLWYFDGTNYVRLPIGSYGYALKVSGGKPVWATASGLGDVVAANNNAFTGSNDFNGGIYANNTNFEVALASARTVADFGSNHSVNIVLPKTEVISNRVVVTEAQIVSNINNIVNASGAVVIARAIADSNTVNVAHDSNYAFNVIMPKVTMNSNNINTVSGMIANAILKYDVVSQNVNTVSGILDNAITKYNAVSSYWYSVGLTNGVASMTNTGQGYVGNLFYGTNINATNLAGTVAIANMHGEVATNGYNFTRMITVSNNPVVTNAQVDIGSTDILTNNFTGTAVTFWATTATIDDLTADRSVFGKGWTLANIPASASGGQLRGTNGGGTVLFNADADGAWFAGKLVSGGTVYIGAGAVGAGIMGNVSNGYAAASGRGSLQLYDYNAANPQISAMEGHASLTLGFGSNNYNRTILIGDSTTNKTYCDDSISVGTGGIWNAGTYNGVAADLTNLNVNGTANIVTGIFKQVTATNVFSSTNITGKLYVNTTNQDANIFGEVSGMLRVSSNAYAAIAYPTTGAGLESYYSGNISYMSSFDRAAVVYRPFQMRGLTIDLYAGAYDIASLSMTGLALIRGTVSAPTGSFTVASITNLNASTGIFSQVTASGAGFIGNANGATNFYKSGTPDFYVSANSNMSIGPSVQTIIPMTNVFIDTANGYSTSTFLYTIPSAYTGYYEAFGGATFETGGVVTTTFTMIYEITPSGPTNIICWGNVVAANYTTANTGLGIINYTGGVHKVKLIAWAGAGDVLLGLSPDARGRTFLSIKYRRGPL